MDFLANPPRWLLDLLPEGGRDFLEAGGWWGLLGFAALVCLLLLWAIGSKVWHSLFGRRPEPRLAENQPVDLAAIPAAKPSTGDRRLTVEGVPVRLRLVVIAPTSHDARIEAEAVPALLEKMVPGLGEIARNDEPVIHVWPVQFSYQGFARLFHRHTPTPEGEGQQSPWVLVAGRAHVGQQQILLGLGLKAPKPTTLARQTLDAHQWPQTLRIRVRD